MPKTRAIRSVDLPVANPFDAGPALSTEASMAPPVQATIGQPTNLQLTTTIERNAVTPTAQIGATWYPPAGVAPSGYIVQWSLSSSFPDPGTTGQAADGQATTIRGLTPNTLYYVRVAAVAGGVTGTWSDTASITTAADTTPPDPVTAQSAAFFGVGDLAVTWTNSASANYRDTEVVIKASSGGATLATRYAGSAPLIWTVAENLAATSGAGDPTVYVELRARSWGGIFSTSVNTGTVTKAAPTAPGVSVNFTGPDAIYTLTPPADAVSLSFVANTSITARRLPIVGRYVYTFDQNRLDNTTPDPTLQYSVTAVDGLNQASAATSGTATNAAPATTAISIFGGYSTIGITITPSTAADLRDYTVRIILGGVTVATYTTTSPNQIYSATASGTYQAGVTVNDVFGQSSSETLSSSVLIDALTIAELRANGTYTNDLSTAPATLDVLKDANLSSGGITTASGIATTWHWFLFTQAQIDRYRTITIAATGGVGYLGLSSDNSTYTWFSGPLNVDGRTLTAVASEAAAQAAAITLPTAAGVHRWELPTMQEARYVKLGHHNTSAVAYTVYEFYPRRLVEGDDIRGESITGINVAASSITADKISVVNLQALSAQMGSLHMDGVIDIASTGGIYQGSGTFASPTTGLKIFNSGGVGKISTYNAGVEQVTFDTDGRLKAGAGAVRIDANGMAILTSSSFSTLRSYAFRDPTAAAVLGGLYASGDLASPIWVKLEADASANSAAGIGQVTIQSIADTGFQSLVQIQAIRDATTYEFDISVGGANPGFTFFGASVNATAGLNIGTASGATSGQIRINNASYYIGWDAGTTSYYTNANLYCAADIYWGTGVNWLSAYLNQAVRTTSNVQFNSIIIANYSHYGNTAVDYIPSTTNWSSGGATILLQGNDFSSIGFHDAGSRIDSIVAGQGVIRIGYDGGWGAAIVTHPGVSKFGGNLYIGSTSGSPSYLIHLSADSAGKPAGGSWTNSTSDARAKTILGQYEYGLDAIRRLNLVRYAYNGMADTPKDMQAVGFVAQEAMEVIPEMVSTRMGKLHPDDEHETELYTLNNDPAIYATMRAVQELAELYDALAARIARNEGGHHDLRHGPGATDPAE